MSASSETLIVVHELARGLYTRRMLLQPPVYHSSINSPPPTASSSQTGGDPYGENGFNANMVMVLSVLLCALVCSIGLNSIVRCALKCSRLAASQSASNTRLANTGMKKKEIKTIPALNYSNELNLQHLDTECVICLSDFAEGERVRVLPKCNHGFHVCCIDQWLTSHSSCPTCRHSLANTSQKKTICSQSSSSEVISTPAIAPTVTQTPPTVPQETILTITPLDIERVVPSYR